MSFVHLHVHTHYSLLESAVKVPDLVKRVKGLEMPAVAVTDLGNMFGAVDFYLAAKAQEIKPILGAEVYLTTGSRLTKEGKAKAFRRVQSLGSEQEDAQRLYHLVLLCKNKQGYENLSEIVSRGFSEGFHFKPRVDQELLAKYSEGLICLSGGLKGELAFHCVQGNEKRAIHSLDWMKEIYKDNLYLEVQENTLPEQSQANRMIADLAKKFSLPMVATSDTHYLTPDKGVAHEVLMCIGVGKSLDENRGVRLAADEFWLKDPATMKKEFSWAPEAISNTLKIADQCNYDFKLTDENGRQIFHLPDYRPQGAESKKKFSVEDELRRQSIEGLKDRFKEPGFEKLVNSKDWKEKKKVYEARLKDELDMIVRTGFSGYFLIVADFIQYAKSEGIPVGPGRGSGAGSLVAYALKITDIDPIVYNLLFERFINPERISMPDFDVDFCQDRRQEVIQYVVDKYGKDQVSQIITFGKLLARGVIRDVGRVMGLSYGEVDALAKLIPEELGITLDAAFQKEPRLEELTRKDPKVAKLFEVARALEGLNRHASVHAAGVVITNQPLVKYCPLYAGKDGESVVQFDKDFAEKIGLVKFDFLGLKTLTVIDNAVKFVRQTQTEKGVKEKDLFDINKIDYFDQKTYELISSGDTDGVFQLESSGMKDLCQRVQPTSVEDLTAINALYRPGPLNSGMVDDYIERKHGRTEVEYLLPQLKEILEETYGVIVYQEQVMRVARVLANYSLGEADILRRAMGKKKVEEMDRQREKFVKGAADNDIDNKTATEIFDLLAKFAQYGFNKSHSAAYAVLAFQTAYLKTYYPAQFMAALMATEMDNTDKMAHYIADAKNHAIDVLPPCVNESQKTFSVVEIADEKDPSIKKMAIRFGLEAIKGVGGVAVDCILEERQKREKPFDSFLDFCKSVPLRKVNKKVLESLISVGAFDSIAEENRATLFESTASVIEHAAKIQEEAELGQVSFFDQYKSEDLKLETNTAHLFKQVAEWPESKKLKTEKQMVGFYVSGHPMDKWWPIAKDFVTGDLQYVLDNFEDKKNNAPKVVEMKNFRREGPRWDVVLVALVGSMREIITRKGTKMAFVDLEDSKSKLETICFPDAYETYAEALKQSSAECLPFIFTGNISLTEESPKLFIRTIDKIEDYQKNRVNTVILQLDPKEVDAHKLAQLRALLVRHRGRCSTFLEYRGKVDSQGFQSRHQLPRELSVRPTAEMAQDVNKLFGKNVIVFR